MYTARMPVRKPHPKRTRNLAFKIWKQEGKSLAKTSRVLKEEHNIKVDPPTLMKWRDRDLWEAKAHLIENQVRKLMLDSDDPVLQEMVLDDAMFMRFLGVMVRLIEQVVGRRQAAKQFMPKNAKELMTMMEFVAQHQERILSKRDQANQVDPNAPRAPRSFTYNDNRQLVLRDRLNELPDGQRREVIQEMHGAVNQKQLAKLREQMFDDDEATG